MNIRKDDNILVITGKDKGKKGKVRFAYPRKQQVLVEGVNFIKKHSKAKGAARQAGIIDLEAPLHISKVMYLCSKCNKPGRIGTKKLEDGRRVRFCRACHEVID
ncbi:MAG: 50S ribosomal protein L24 [Chloroflexi bacterium RBG_13_52_12]|nr:MAG: 50S ribosomal protein L24 [Chloroflexi bacterium RBG_13_52_12]